MKTVPSRSDDEVRCTYYPDLMIREIGTNTPGPSNALLLRGGQPAGSRNRLPGAITLKTEGQGFVGRAGPFLVFQAADPTGASQFVVIDADSGKTIYSDGVTQDGLHVAAVESGALHLKYLRAFNASCSIPKDGVACWAKIAAEGKIPRAMAQMPAPRQACEAAYKIGSTPAEDPSLISYEVDVLLDPSGRAQVLSRGAVQCGGVP